MEYGYPKLVNLDFGSVLEQARHGLRSQGFGVVTEINMQNSLKERLGIEYSKYQVLQACDPELAYEALEIDKEVGLLLPCNLIVYETEEGVIVSAVLPTVSMIMVRDPRLKELAKQAEHRLKRVIDRIG